MQHIRRAYLKHHSFRFTQFSETIKLLQFQKLYRKDGEDEEEWMGRAAD